MKRFVLLLLFYCFELFQASPQFNPQTNDKKAMAAYNKALAAQNARNFKLAWEQYNLALNKDPNFAEAHFRKAQVAQALDDRVAMLFGYEQAITLKPQFAPFAQAYYYLGLEAYQNQAYPKAIDLLSSYKTMAVKSPVLVTKAQKMLVNASFALSAVKQPLDIKPVSLGRTVNSFHSQYFPSLTGDREQLIYTGFNNLSQDENIYVSTWKNKAWSAPMSISKDINTTENEGTAAVSADGKTLVFTACNAKDGFGSCDLYVSYKVKNQWQKPSNLGPTINTHEWESQPSLSADGTTLYFVSDRKGGRGGKDIFTSNRQTDGEWTEAVNLGDSINTSDDEISPFIHPNGLSFFFASNGYPGMGGMDIYFSDRTPAGWSAPQNMGYPLNTHRDQVSLFITADNKKGYYSLEQSQDSEGRNSMLYQFDLPQKIAQKIRKANVVKGFISDARTQRKISATVEVINLSTKQTESTTVADEQTGEYLNFLNQGGNYGLFVSKPGYFFKSIPLDYSSEVDSLPRHLDISLEPLLKNSHETLNNLYFDTNKFELKPNSIPELEKLLKLLQLNPALTIEVAGHTDDVGKDAENQLLSQNRAKAVKMYLEAKGIKPTRILAKGYGKTQPAVPNISAENRAQNRRIEITIL
jgi:outer membrane protein OmpA-like peptidoglycan-associated protein